jgi:predicted TIM-barrel fold metal-dependent hydrolase
MYDGVPHPSIGLNAVAGKRREEYGLDPTSYDGMRPGCYTVADRIADMDVDGIHAQVCFPSFPGFAGSTFFRAPDKQLAEACVTAWNDWMIDEWCAGAGHGRLIPLTLIPLWDPALAAAEVRRCAAKGSFAVAFSENPVRLKLPSIFTDHWDPFFAACEESDTVVNLHIGSSSTFPMTSLDAPRAVSLALTYQGAAHALSDWLTSGVLDRFPRLKMALSEGQVGWIPFIVERLDSVWHERPVYGNLEDRLTKPPSAYIPGRVYGCVFDDAIGLKIRDEIGIEQIMFETDYPHGDSTWPHSRAVAEKLAAAAGLDERETYLLTRGNAIECYGLHRFGITA